MRSIVEKTRQVEIITTMRSIVEKTRQVELGLTHDTEKEGRADWHLAILTLPPTWTGRGCSRAKSSSKSQAKNPTARAFSAVDLSHHVLTQLFDLNVLIRGR